MPDNYSFLKNLTRVLNVSYLMLSNSLKLFFESKLEWISESYIGYIGNLFIHKMLKFSQPEIKLISRFNQIEILESSYILIDIDDTVFDYGELIDSYWLQKPLDPSYEIWHKLICDTTPTLTDNEINLFIEKAISKGCIIVFITHRNHSFNDITKKHLKENSLDMIPVHFLSGSSKGDYIRRNFVDRQQCFIDDSKKNILDVSSKNAECKCYQFKKFHK